MGRGWGGCRQEGQAGDGTGRDETGGGPHACVLLGGDEPRPSVSARACPEGRRSRLRGSQRHIYLPMSGEPDSVLGSAPWPLRTSAAANRMTSDALWARVTGWEEHKSELQTLMSSSYASFGSKTNKLGITTIHTNL